jgi:hypothetical protein
MARRDAGGFLESDRLHLSHLRPAHDDAPVFIFIHDGSFQHPTAEAQPLTHL